MPNNAELQAEVFELLRDENTEIRSARWTDCPNAAGSIVEASPRPFKSACAMFESSATYTASPGDSLWAISTASTAITLR